MGQILFRFTKEFAKDSTPETKGDDVIVTSTLLMDVSDDIISYFNIPVPVAAELEEAAGARAVDVPEFTYTRYASSGEATGVATTVSAYSRTSSGGGRGTIKNVARVPMMSRIAETSKKPRTTSFKFPSFFTVYMIDQAIGSMIKANEPPNYELRGKRRLFIPNASTGPFAGVRGGAWITGTFEPAVNAGDTDTVAEVTTTTSGRRATATAVTPPPAGI